MYGVDDVDDDGVADGGIRLELGADGVASDKRIEGPCGVFTLTECRVVSSNVVVETAVVFSLDPVFVLSRREVDPDE
jgi:hypothetical protein